MHREQHRENESAKDVHCYFPAKWRDRSHSFPIPAMTLTNGGEVA
jgi:hypothetical protein